jgi:molybdopterin-guanine dinucleotide biosynthesis protein A
MGCDKATLSFGPGETMLQRVVRLASEAVPMDRIVCVAAPDQSLPPLPAAVRVVFDPVPYGGPLAGLATGLATIEQEAEAAFLAGCDAPLLKPAFVLRMFELLADYQIAAPHDGERWHPLAAVYRADLRPMIESLLASGSRSVVALIESCHTRRVATTQLHDVDPELETLITCNTSEEYHVAQERVAGVERKRALS